MLILRMLLLCCAATLTACGGGDPEPDQPTPAVDCQARPELCK